MGVFRELLQLVVFVVVFVGGYIGLITLTHYPFQMVTAIGIGILGVLIFAVLLFIRWMSPMRGKFGTVGQESTLLRVLDREISRSIRHGHPLVVALIKAKRLKFQKVRDDFRNSDLVFKGVNGQFLVILTETSLEQGTFVMERFVQRYPVHAVAVIDAALIPSATRLIGVGSRYATKEQTIASRPLIAMLRGLQLGLFRAQVRYRQDQLPPVYVVTPEDIRLSVSQSYEGIMNDLTKKIA